MTGVLVPPPPLTPARQAFVTTVVALVDQVVLMGALDCSELVAVGVRAASNGKVQQNGTHTAQRYFNETRKLGPADFPMPGDLGFYGTDADHVFHVVVYIGPGKILSADGATIRIGAVNDAIKAGAKVRVHSSEHYRLDVPFLGWHRNDVVDSISFVTL